MPAVGFDVQGARQHGYSDQDILNAVAQKSGFDLQGARNAGYSDDEIFTKLTGAAPAVDPNAGAKKVADEQSLGDTLLIGAGRTFDRIGKGMQQAYYAATGDQASSDKLKAEAAEDDRVYAPLKQARPVATAVGESLPAMAVPIGGTPGALATVAKVAGSAAAQKGLEYGTVGERLQNAAEAGAGAAVGGVVIPKVVGVASNAVKGALKGLAGNITPEAMALYQRAQELGIPVNVAQLGDSKFMKTLASSVEQMPFTGAAQKVVDQKNAFNRAVSNTFGEDTEKVTPQVYAAAKQRLGQEFDTLTARNQLNVTPDVEKNIGKILDDAHATASDDTIRAMQNIADRVGNQSKNGTTALLDSNGQPLGETAMRQIPGATYQSIDTQLSNMVKAGGEKGLYAKRLQSELRNAMDNSISSEDQAAWQTTRSQYRNLKAVRDIVAKDAANGDIPPTQLMNALTNSEAGKEAMAMGARGTLGDLGQIGRSFVRDAVPNSGTAQRAMAMGLIGGGGFAFGASPAAIGGMMIGAATAGRMVTKMLNDPRVVTALQQHGLSTTDVLSMPPNRAIQIIGGITGMTTLNNIGEQNDRDSAQR